MLFHFTSYIKAILTGYKYDYRLICAFLLSIFIFVSTSAAEQVAEEYQIKAVYLFNFGSFFTWPNQVFKDQTFYICVLGQDPFSTNLDITVKNEKIEGRPVVIKRLTHIKDSDACQILFISHSEEKQLRKIFQFLGKKPILTVGDSERFAVQGGMIQFFVNDHRQVRFSIVPEIIKATGLIVSANLLEIAQIIRRRP